MERAAGWKVNWYITGWKYINKQKADEKYKILGSYPKEKEVWEDMYKQGYLFTEASFIKVKNWKGRSVISSWFLFSSVSKAGWASSYNPSHNTCVCNCHPSRTGWAALFFLWYKKVSLQIWSMQLLAKVSQGQVELKHLSLSSSLFLPFFSSPHIFSLPLSQPVSIHPTTRDRKSL